jgi:hypothetical protein
MNAMHQKLNYIKMRDLSFSRSSGLWRHVTLWWYTKISEVHAAPISIVTLKMEAARSSETLVFYHNNNTA